MENFINKIHNLDARNLESVLKNCIVDVTITSPPYFDLKDYGSKNQIGYGQSYDKYLLDLQLVFQKVYNVTKPKGTLWVVIDTFKKNGEVVPLPFDFVRVMNKIKWKLQEIIIWEKDKTVPWAHQGQVRNLFEYILVFSKSDKYNFFIDRVRDFENLKKWWIRYPERYNPNGKGPTEIWKFKIPTQGSWGNGYIRHFCPLPEEMIEQILELSSNKNDVILDPFAGSGAVLVRSYIMNRKFVGFELNKEYISMFKKYLTKTGELKKQEYVLSSKNRLKRDKFYDLIVKLRTLKYGRIIYKKLSAVDKKNIRRIFITVLDKTPEVKHKFISAHYMFLTPNSSEKEKLLSKIDEFIKIPPLSKFGISPTFELVNGTSRFYKKIKNKMVYVYTARDTHCFKKRINVSTFSKLENSDLILSDIKIQINEKEFMD